MLETLYRLVDLNFRFFLFRVFYWGSASDWVGVRFFCLDFITLGANRLLRLLRIRTIGEAIDKADGIINVIAWKLQC